MSISQMNIRKKLWWRRPALTSGTNSHANLDDVNERNTAKDYMNPTTRKTNISHPRSNSSNISFRVNQFNQLPK